MRKVLIIKTGASGDVVRTTVLLHAFAQDSVTWITNPINVDLLPHDRPEHLHITTPNDFVASPEKHYDIVISLDDEKKCAEIASIVSSKELYGAYLEDGKVKYQGKDVTWFDMSLISQFGIEEANARKKINQLSYQQLIFQLLGWRFNEEPYLINNDIHIEKYPKRIGLEARSGDRWPTKVWHKYDQLATWLSHEGYEPFFFTKKPTMQAFMQDVASCEAIVTGDTLAMHLALAFEIPNITIFTCTSHTEIESYGLMKKIISPKLDDVFYTREYRADALEAITLDEVKEELMLLLKSSMPLH